MWLLTEQGGSWKKYRPCHLSPPPAPSIGWIQPEARSSQCLVMPSKKFNPLEQRAGWRSVELGLVAKERCAEHSGVPSLRLSGVWWFKRAGLPRVSGNSIIW
jgi:hypothetical protein